MENNRIKNVKRNAIWAFGNKMIQIVIPFFVRTILIYTLGAEYAGLGGVFSSILKILSLAELGFSSAITYNMYKPIAEEDKSRICALLNLYRKLYGIIGIIVLVLGIGLMPFLPYLIEGDLPTGINIYILFFLYLLNSFFSYRLFAYRTSLLNAYQRYDIISAVSGGVQIFVYLLEILSLVWLKNYYCFVISMILGTVVNNILILYISKKMFPDISCEGELPKEIILDVKKRVKALLGHRIGTAVLTSADTVIISAFLGLLAVTMYNNYYYIIAALIGVIDVILGSATASIGNSLVSNSREKNYSLFLKINFVTFWMVGIFAIGYVILIQDFVRLWLGSDYLYTSAEIVVLFGFYFYLWKIRSALLRYKEAAGMWNEDFWKPYVAAIVNVGLGVFLVMRFGIQGVIISTIITMVFVNLPWELYVLHKKLFFEKQSTMYKMIITHTMISSIVGVGVWFSLSWILVENWFVFACKLFTCLLLSNMLFWAVYRKHGYWQWILSVILRKN